MTLMKNIVLATALALPATAGLAQGVEHRVLVERWGFFPQPIYVQPGDTITFENAAPNWVRLWTDDWDDNLAGYNFSNPCALDGNGQARYDGDGDGDQIPWFNIGDERTITVTECMETSYMEPEVWQFGFDGDARIDLIVFGTAPNGS